MSLMSLCQFSHACTYQSVLASAMRFWDTSRPELLHAASLPSDFTLQKFTLQKNWENLPQSWTGSLNVFQTVKACDIPQTTFRSFWRFAKGLGVMCLVFIAFLCFPKAVHRKCVCFVADRHCIMQGKFCWFKRENVRKCTIAEMYWSEILFFTCNVLYHFCLCLFPILQGYETPLQETVEISPSHQRYWAQWSLCTKPFRNTAWRDLSFILFGI